MKYTILSEKDLKIIEKAILKFGRIVSTSNLLELFTEEYSKTSAYNRIQALSNAGWFLRIKNGLYLIIDSLSSRSTSDISLLLIAQAINKDSYISLNWALNYYQMFDQYSKTISIINKDISKKYKFQNNEIKFIKINKKYFFGFSQTRIDGELIQIAQKEKALLDYLYLENSFYSANIVFEIITNYKHEIDFSLLEDFASKYNTTVQRKIGFLLDQININTENLLLNIKKNKGYSRFTKESKIFNAKWRIYYDDRIIK
jgi:predicted transcriptional regulator of viral defense system